MEQSSYNQDKFIISRKDGGLATHLTTLGFVYPDSSSGGRLWSSAALLTPHGREILARVHEDYLRAGADVVETDTYHLCEANLCGVDGATVEGLAQLAVETLDDVVRRHGAHRLQSGGVGSQREIRRALSLGPYAVALADAAEYTGVYPNLSSITLESFHLCRLAALASSPCHWSRIDVLAFETVPRVDEVSAIRRAVARLYDEYTVERKPLWISCVYPHGRMPGWDLDEESGDLDLRGGMQKLVEGLLSLGGDASVQVEGIGINCTHPSYLPSLVRDLTREITTYWTTLETPRRMLTLLLYPDGGKEWDQIARKYKPGGMSINEWVASVREAVLAADNEFGRGVWDEIVVGGCCNTGPEHITLLGDSQF